jgi:large subunit ribosomal protein L25
MAREIPKISVEPRERLGTRYARRVRESGRMPGVIYGHGADPVHVSCDQKEFTHIMHENAHLIEVNVAGKAEPCLIKDVQWDHLGKHLVHVDLARVDLSETVTVEVSIQIKGEAEGLKEEGAILENPVTQIEVQCRADNIPELVEVDVTSLKVDQEITVADLKLPAGVVCTMDPQTTIAIVTIVSEEAEPVTAEAGPAEPEVIGRKPDAEGEAEAK